MKIKSVDSVYDLAILTYTRAHNQKCQICSCTMYVELNPWDAQYHKNVNNKILILNNFHWSKRAFYVI